MNKISIRTAEAIAKRYGFHQVVIIARKVGDEGYEAVTTYGTTEAHCSVATAIGEFLTNKIMKWRNQNEPA